MNTGTLGIYVAPVTPYTSDGSINPFALEALMNRNQKEGADGFFIGGSSAECFILTPEERILVFETASQFKNETNLIAHVGSISTQEAIRYAQAAKSLGYQSISATPPLYYGFSSKEICNYFYSISRAADLPVIIYNFPGNTKIDFNLDNPDYRALFASSAVEGVKHTNQVVYQMERILELNPSLKVFNGFDETMVAGLALGAHGSIGSTFNCMLPHYKKIMTAFLSGDLDPARELQHKANNIMQTFCRFGLISSIKYVLSMQGIDAGIARQPFMPLSDEDKQTINIVLNENLILS